MHIEPGFVTPAKVMLANAGAIGVIAWGVKEQAVQLLREPWAPLKTLAAAGFFSLFMQSYSVPVGASELHFIGAMAMYLTLGFMPTLLGFALGLAFQGLVFDPADMLHLGVNSLSLMLPLIAVHTATGHKLFNQSVGQRLTWQRIVALDALYYTGVTAMVGFWLLISTVETPLASWLAFAGSYLAVVAIEPFVTWGIVRTLKRYEGNVLVARLSVVGSLRTA
ncbi:MAG: cobalamin biosynthesis protein CbiM [Rhodospirillaceae bacterium BRH_c57]|nr:MAG: cobalamin biosynthesis protein CbiM [Rhodospirillaceae bacterium BRH_c57]